MPDHETSPPITDLSFPQHEGANETLTTIDSLSNAARQLLASSSSPATQMTYRHAWAAFADWCAARDACPLPAKPTTLIEYIVSMAGGDQREASTSTGLRMATIDKRLAAISQAHQLARFESPTKDAVFRKALKGLRRQIGTRQHCKAPLLTQDILHILVNIQEPTLPNLWDKAILLLGFAGGFRRSELVALNVEDLRFVEEGIRVMLKRGKADQEGQGREVGIAKGHPGSCPVETVRQWLEAAQIIGEPVFRPLGRKGLPQAKALSDRAVARIVKRLAGQAGLDPRLYAGHSLRAGLATQAALNGVPERIIMAQTGHKTQMMLRRYIRIGGLFRENASAQLGL